MPQRSRPQNPALPYSTQLSPPAPNLAPYQPANFKACTPALQHLTLPHSTHSSPTAPSHAPQYPALPTSTYSSPIAPSLPHVCSQVDAHRRCSIAVDVEGAAQGQTFEKEEQGLLWKDTASRSWEALVGGVQMPLPIVWSS